jgi:magnesium chelatase subunit D
MPLFKEDLREPLRQIKPARLVVLSVDASGSMGADRRMQMAKGAILGYLIQAYQRRDRVALVTFGGDGARVVLKPTGSVEVARARLGVLPTGGCTPLSLGIRTAVNLAESTCSHSDLLPLLVLVTDGRATAATTGADPWEEALCSARDVNRKKISSIVVDAEQARVPLGLARELAVAMGAAYVRLESSEADDLIAAWSTEELGSPEQGSAP